MGKYPKKDKIVDQVVEDIHMDYKMDFKRVLFFAMNDCRNALSKLKGEKPSAYSGEIDFELARSNLLALHALIASFYVMSNEKFSLEDISKEYKLTRSSMMEWFSKIIIEIGRKNLFVEKIIGDRI